MKKILLLLLSGSAIGAIGYRIGYHVSKKKYEGIADEEVKSLLKVFYESKGDGVREMTKKILKENSPSPEDDSKTPTESTHRPSVAPVRESDLQTKLTDLKTDYGKKYRKDDIPERIPGQPENERHVFMRSETKKLKGEPYIISPEEFKDGDYEVVTLYYCADKVLTDADYNRIHDISIVGGYSNLEQMGLMEPDCLYVRDEKSGIDYEIALEERTFNTLLGIVDEE